MGDDLLDRAEALRNCYTAPDLSSLVPAVGFFLVTVGAAPPQDVLPDARPAPERFTWTGGKKAMEAMTRTSVEAAKRGTFNEFNE